jgi:hypothetical protein
MQQSAAYEKPGKIEALMAEAGIRYEDFHSPADYSSDEEEIARAGAVLAEDVRAALEAFNLGCRKRLVRNARRESLDAGYSSEVDSSD